VPDGGLFLDPHGRLAQVSDGKLKVLGAAEREQLGTNVHMDGAFGDADIPVRSEDVYIIASPAVRDDVASMLVVFERFLNPMLDGLDGSWSPIDTAWREG